MNYYMPYFSIPSNIPMGIIPSTTSKGFFSRLFSKGLNWGSILNTTQKTLSVVNQAIPVIKQVSPVMKNAKTIFKVMNEFKRIDIPSDSSEDRTNQVSQTKVASVNKNVNQNNIIYDGSPTFFIN